MGEQPHLFQINEAFLAEASHYERTGDTVHKPCLAYNSGCVAKPQISMLSQFLRKKKRAILDLYNC